MVKTGRAACLRQWMVKNLHKVENNTSNAFDKTYMERITQQDIENKINRTVLQQEQLNINDKKTLGKVLRGY